MSLNRVARPSCSTARQSDQSLWLVVPILLLFLLTQVLPDETPTSVGAGSASWENAEDDSSNNLDQGYRTTPISTSYVRLAPAQLPETDVVVARLTDSRRVPSLVAPGPRGPPESRLQTKKRVSNRGRAPPSCLPPAQFS